MRQQGTGIDVPAAHTETGEVVGVTAFLPIRAIESTM
jgi:hypothetical protein